MDDNAKRVVTALGRMESQSGECVALKRARSSSDAFEFNRKALVAQVWKELPFGFNRSGIVAAGSSLCLNGFQLANVLRRKIPVFGTVDDQPFVIVTGQRRIKLRIAAIKCNEERPFRVTLPPYVVIFASVLVPVVGSCGSVAFSFVEVFQFIVREFINDTQNIFRLIGQDVRDATIALGRLKRKCQPVCG